MSDFSSSGSRVTLEGYLVTGLITEAYNLKSYQVSFATSVPQPDMTYYDIMAKPRERMPEQGDEFRQMLQTLLAERFHIEATPEFRINNNTDPGDIRIFTAIQEQLGLKLEPQKNTVEILVVDHVEKPSAN